MQYEIWMVIKVCITTNFDFIVLLKDSQSTDTGIKVEAALGGLGMLTVNLTYERSFSWWLDLRRREPSSLIVWKNISSRNHWPGQAVVSKLNKIEASGILKVSVLRRKRIVSLIFSCFPDQLELGAPNSVKSRRATSKLRFGWSWLHCQMFYWVNQNLCGCHDCWMLSRVQEKKSQNPWNKIAWTTSWSRQNCFNNCHRWFCCQVSLYLWKEWILCQGKRPCELTLETDLDLIIRSKVSLYFNAKRTFWMEFACKTYFESWYEQKYW